MEFQFFSFPTLSTIALFILLIVKLVKNISSSRKANLPPGPWKLPFIGNLHQLASSAPHKKLRDLANKYGPLMHLKLGEVSAVIVTSPDMAKMVMKTKDINFASRPHNICSRIISYNSSSIIFAPYGDYWRYMRKICTLELLTAKRVLAFRPIREQEVMNLAKFILSNEGNIINITEKIISTMFCIISRLAIGRKLQGNDTELLVSIIKEGARLAAGFNAADFFPSISFIHSVSNVKPKVEALHKEIDRILDYVIVDHELSKETASEVNEDLVHVLLKLKDNTEFPLEYNNIKAVLLDVIGAGTETAATTIDWALAELLKNPREMAKVQEEVRHLFAETGDVVESDIPKLKYLNLVIKEILRLHIPLPLLLPRENNERCIIDGYEIPSKIKVIINAWAIARDPKYWDEPDKFNPERFLDNSINFNGNDFEYLPFGAGRRICAGMEMGLINVKFFLAQLLFHFDWKLPAGMKETDIDMTEVFGSAMGRKSHLRMVPTVYQKSHFAR